MSGNAIPVTLILASGLFLTIVAWKVLDLAMHAMSLDRAPHHAAAGDKRERPGHQRPTIG